MVFEGQSAADRIHKVQTNNNDRNPEQAPMRQLATLFRELNATAANDE